MKTKMTMQEFKNLFPEWESMPGRNNATSATRKGFVHKHNPSRKPAKGNAAVWKRAHRKAKR